MAPSKPQQARSRRTLEKILDGCDQLLVERTIDKVTMQDVASAAGVSVGNLYNRFEDRNALIEQVMVRHQQRFLARFSAWMDNASKSSNLQVRLRELAEVFQNELVGLRPVFLMMVSQSPVARDSVDANRKGSDQIIDAATDWLLRDLDPQQWPISRERCRFAVASMAFTLQYDLLFGTASRLFGDALLDSVANQAHHHLSAPVED